jgi:hypothetical protein
MNLRCAACSIKSLVPGSMTAVDPKRSFAEIGHDGGPHPIPAIQGATRTSAFV